MKNILIATVLLALLFTQTACDDDFFSQVVEVEIPEHESTVVLNGIWSSQDEEFSVSISNSLGIVDESEYTYPTDATVKFYKNDVFESDLIYNPSRQKYQTPTGYLLEEEATYKVEAQFGNLKTASVSEKMPKKVDITAVEYEKDGAIGEFGEKMDKHIITFTDPADEENYYSVNAKSLYGSSSNELYLESVDPTVSDTFLGLVFSDKTFNGQTLNFRMTSYSLGVDPNDENNRVQYEVLNISKATYLYHKSLIAFYDAQDNPFAEPATVHSNVTDGYGIFGLMTSDTMSIKL